MPDAEGGLTAAREIMQDLVLQRGFDDEHHSDAHVEGAVGLVEIESSSANQELEEPGRRPGLALDHGVARPQHAIDVAREATARDVRHGREPA